MRRRLGGGFCRGIRFIGRRRGRGRIEISYVFVFGTLGTSVLFLVGFWGRGKGFVGWDGWVGLDRLSKICFRLVSFFLRSLYLTYAIFSSIFIAISSPISTLWMSSSSFLAFCAWILTLSYIGSFCCASLPLSSQFYIRSHLTPLHSPVFIVASPTPWKSI